MENHIKEIVAEIEEHVEISEPLSPESPPPGSQLPCVCPLSCASSLARKKVELKKTAAQLHRRKSAARRDVKKVQGLEEMQTAFGRLLGEARELQDDQKLFLSLMTEMDTQQGEISDLDQNVRGAKIALEGSLKEIRRLREHSEICQREISRLEAELKASDEKLIHAELERTEEALEETRAATAGLYVEIETLREMIGKKSMEIVELQTEVEPQQTALDEVSEILGSRRNKMRERLEKFEKLRRDAIENRDNIEGKLKFSTAKLRTREAAVAKQESDLRIQEATLDKAEEIESEAMEVNLELAVLEEQKRMLITKILEVGRTIARTKRGRENVPPWNPGRKELQ